MPLNKIFNDSVSIPYSPQINLLKYKDTMINKCGIKIVSNYVHVFKKKV